MGDEIDLTNIIALAFALAFDAFGVAIAVGIQLGNLDRWTIFRLSFHFGFSQFGMPIIGFYAGSTVLGFLGQYGNWAAALILFIIGVHLIWEQFNPEERKWKGDPTRGGSLLFLMFATSIDALAAGFSLALVGIQILYPTLIIGVVAAVMTILGLIFGNKMGLKFSKIAGIIGGVILILISFKSVIF